MPTGPRRAFGGRLKAFMHRCGKTRQNRFSLFLDHFVDGKDGRSGDFSTFASDFREFLRSFHRPVSRPWADRNEVGEEPGEEALLGDLPTWLGGRSRAEPWFGEAHARTAARILHGDGEHELAIAAWCWSLTVDEWDPKDVSQLADLLHAQWDRIGAWTLQIEACRRFPAATGRAQEAHRLRRCWPVTRRSPGVWNPPPNDDLAGSRAASCTKQCSVPSPRNPCPASSWRG